MLNIIIYDRWIMSCLHLSYSTLRNHSTPSTTLEDVHQIYLRNVVPLYTLLLPLYQACYRYIILECVRPANADRWRLSPTTVSNDPSAYHLPTQNISTRIIHKVPPCPQYNTYIHLWLEIYGSFVKNSITIS